jgi:uncharacterized membrane protein
MSEDLPSRETLEQLIERLDHLERVLQANTARLHAVELRLGLDPTPQGARQRRPTYERLKDERDEQAAATPPTGARERATEAGGTRSPHDSPTAAHDASSTFGARAHATGASQSQTGASQAQTESAYGGASAQSEASRGAAGRAPVRRDIESVIGGSWFNWIGIIAVTFGVAFFLKFAFDNQWIGPGARVALGGAAGLALLYVAERLRARGLRQYAYVLSGGGLLILYLSIYAARTFYDLINQPVAFLLMAVVTGAAVLLAVRHNALAVAILGLVGGFLTPILLSTGVDNQLGLFTYIALLDAGVLAVAYFKRWRSLDFLSFAGTVLMTLGWAAMHYRREKLLTTLVFISVFFILYALLAVFHNVLSQRRSRWFDVALLIANATIYFGAAYLLLDDAGYDHVAPASHALLVSTFFTCLFYAAWRWSREDRLLAYSYVGAAVVFFTTAVAIQLELQWVTIAWAIEALMLLWIGLRSGESAPRHAALAVFGVASLHWLAWDAPEFSYRAAAGFLPLLNQRALSCLVLIGALAAAAWLYRRERAGVGDEERSAAGTLCTLAANALAFALLTLDLNDYFERRKWLASGQPADGSYGLNLSNDGFENTRQFSLSALWTIYGAMLLYYGVRRNFRVLRFAGFALLVLATIKVFALDLSFYAASWHTPVFNQTFTAFALLVAAYALAVWLYAKDGRIGDDERAVVPILVVIANVLALVALSAEAAGYFQSRIAAEWGRVGPGMSPASPEFDARLRDLELAKQLSLSVMWAVYGGGLLVAGRVWRVRLLRLMALALLSLTTLKVFFWDLSSLDRVYRIVSFIMLGLILLAVSYLYQKSQQRAASEAEADEAEPQT